MEIAKDRKSVQYLNIYHHFVNDIVNQVYPYSSKLPSKRTIADKEDVSVITVEHALELLEDEGYIEARQRSGYFVTYREADFNSTITFVRPKVNIIDTTDTNTENETFPYGILQKTIRKVILDYEDRLLVKSPNKGIVELREEIALYLERSRSIHVDPDQIIIGSGAEYLYGLIAQVFAGRTFAIEDPGYEKILKVYDAMKLEVEKLKLTEDGISSEDLKSSKAKVLHVTPFHSYPSGVTIGISKKKEYLKWAKKNNCVIIEDNYDSELTVSRKQEDPLFSITDSDNVIYLNTFSQTISSAFRIGYMILPKGLIDEFEEMIGFYSCTVPVLDQLIIYELIRNGDFERHINRVRRKKRKEISSPTVQTNNIHYIE